MPSDLSGFKNYEEWAAANRAAGGRGLRAVYERELSGGRSPLGQAGAGTAEQQRTGAKPAGTFRDDSPDAGNARTGDPYLDELRSGKVAGSEDWRRFTNAELKAWEPYYIGGGKFMNQYGDIVGKPQDSGPNTPSGMDGMGNPIEGRGRGGGSRGGGGGGGGGRGGGVSLTPGPGGTYGGAPAYTYPEFTPPSYEEAMADPGYQFALREGLGAITRGAYARGVGRTSGTAKDLIDYGQQAAATQYQNVWDREAAKYGINRETSRDIFAPRYGSWQTVFGAGEDRWRTRYGGDLSKYLQQENLIYNTLMSPPPMYPGY